ncbi:MAG: hypothetical protein RSD51_03340 [Malacoplasma sp.]
MTDKQYKALCAITKQNGNVWPNEIGKFLIYSNGADKVVFETTLIALQDSKVAKDIKKFFFDNLFNNIEFKHFADKKEFVIYIN